MRICHDALSQLFFEIKQETSFSRVNALHRCGTSLHIGSGAGSLYSPMDEFSANLPSNKRMADAVQRGVLLKELAPLVEVLKRVMKDSARLNSHERRRAEVVDLLRAEVALHVPMDVDGAFLRGPKGKEKMKDKGTLRSRKLSGNCIFAGRNINLFVLCRPPGN